MRSSFSYILLLFSLVCLVSCENDIDLKSDNAELLIGNWVSPRKVNHKWKVIAIEEKTLTIYSVKSEYFYRE